VELREVPHKVNQISQISRLKGFRLLFHIREEVQIFLGYLFLIKYKGDKSTIHAAAYSGYRESPLQPTAPILNLRVAYSDDLKTTARSQMSRTMNGY
jgi:hypothetical protein